MSAVKFFTDVAAALAERKARKLLYRFLTDEQRVSYQKDGHFFHQQGERLYQIGWKWEPRIMEHVDGRVDHICVLFKDWTYVEQFRSADNPEPPPADLILAQLLMIKYDEQQTRKIANVFENASHAQVDAMTACYGWCECPPHVFDENDEDQLRYLRSFIGLHSAWPRPDKRKYPTIRRKDDR